LGTNDATLPCLDGLLLLKTLCLPCKPCKLASTTDLSCLPCLDGLLLLKTLCLPCLDGLSGLPCLKTSLATRESSGTSLSRLPCLTGLNCLTTVRPGLQLLTRWGGSFLLLNPLPTCIKSEFWKELIKVNLSSACIDQITTHVKS
jgi:hypothetical protein